MKLNGADLAVTAVLVGAGCAAVYAGLARLLRHAVAERQRETERRISAMAMTLKTLQRRVAELDRSEAERAQEIEAASETVPKQESNLKIVPVKPEIVAALTAAATTFLGTKARIRSAQLVPAAQDAAGAWAQQGRVIVQTSHNLRPNG